MTEYAGWMKDDLVNELHSRGLDATGTKADLAQRLSESDAANAAPPAQPDEVLAPVQPPTPTPTPEPEPVAPPVEEPRGAFPGEPAEIAESVTYVASQGVQVPGIFGGVDTS